MIDRKEMIYAQALAHADFLATTFDMIDAPHREASNRLAHWIVSKYDSKTGLDVIVVCTGNSRRSMMGASMGNLAAAYYGLPGIRFYSGGTAATAFNSRSIATLEDVGFVVEKTGEEASRGHDSTPNPKYRVSWGAGLEAIEFSKNYADKSNPQHGFAALLVCTEADADCPIVNGADLRLSMPYRDPKEYDGSAFESIKYAERRDDIGRAMLAALSQARLTLQRDHDRK